VNLLGDHTDYYGGFVLPTIIPQQTTVQIGIGVAEDEFYSAAFNQHLRFPRSAPLSGFARYISGCVRVLEQAGLALPPLRMAVQSDVPIGAGLSSSAALEIATLRALNAYFGFGLDPVRLAQLAQSAEVKYGGVSCGIMDQMACSLGRLDWMLFLDTRTLEYKMVPLPQESEVLVVDTGVSRELARSLYNTRKAECDAAANELGVAQLRDVSDPSAPEQLSEPLRRRARHVIHENRRVLQAIGADAATFGGLMNESHRSLSCDYEVSVPAVDQIVDWLQHQDGVFGARMTGAGFGGACVALAESGSACEISRHLLSLNWQCSVPSIVVPAGSSTPEQTPIRQSP
jgi:galactokinase